MAFQSQFKTTPKMCRNGARENCPVQRCRFQHTTPAHVIYSTTPKGAVPPPPTPVTSPAGTCFPSAEHGARGWRGDVNAHAQHVRPSVENAAPRDMNGSATAPSGALDADALAQATDGLAIYRAWLENQVEVQKAKIQAMSKQYDIPVPQLDLDSLDFSPLGMSMATTAPNGNFRSQQQQPEVPSAPQAPRLEPAQPIPHAPTHVPQSAPATNRYNHEGPISATPMYAHETLTAAPRKLDISYKTTPCRHFTLNRGWCPWGDDCCFIHDPALEWVPPPDRGSSGRSTPSSTTLVGGTYKPAPAPNYTMNGAAEPNTIVRSSSSQSAHCWGYIQGLCPHSADTCKFLHPSNVLPYIKYTPCLSWPRCGYPTQECPLKHPQVDKLPTSSRQITNAPQSLIIPHEAAYASAVQHHNPVPPSAETFSPPPPRVAVRLSHPSSNDVIVSAGQIGGFGALGGGGLQGRERRVSIAVQREYMGGALGGDGKEFVRGHGRGRSMM